MFSFQQGETFLTIGKFDKVLVKVWQHLSCTVCYNFAFLRFTKYWSNRLNEWLEIVRTFWKSSSISSGERSFIARQHAMHAERDIVMAYPSVRPSVQCRHCV